MVNTLLHVMYCTQLDAEERLGPQRTLSPKITEMGDGYKIEWDMETAKGCSRFMADHGV